MCLQLLAWSESANLPVHTLQEPESVAEFLKILIVENRWCNSVVYPIPESVSKMEISIMSGFNAWKDRIRFVFGALMLVAACLCIPVSAQAQRVRLPKSFAAPSDAQSTGQLPASQQIGITISLPLRNTQALETLIKQLHDPSSPQYGKYLDGQQLTLQFGPTPAVHAKVLGY